MAIINNNVQNVRFLRNGTLYANRDAALNALSGQTLVESQDGSIILARYGSGNNVKTLVGLVYATSENNSLTIFDIDGASADVNELREEINAKLGNGVGSGDSETVTAQLTALSGNTASTSAETSVEGAKRYADDKVTELVDGLKYTDTAETGSYVSAVNETDGVISVTRVALPDANSVANDNKIVTDVTQSKGAITATASLLSGVKLSGYTVGGDDSAAVAETDTLGQALGKLQGQINGMDLTAVSGDGEVITAVSEENGKVSASKTAIKDVKLTGYTKDTTKTGDIAATDDIEDALSKLENKIGANTVTAKDKSIVVDTTGSTTEVGLNIRSGERVLKLDTDATTGGVYTNLNLVKITTDLPAEIKESYELRDSDNAKIGDSIDIPKDSHIVSITYITNSGDTHYQNLEYVYIDVSGNTQTEYVDISSLVLEAEFASGVTITNHVAHGVVDPQSEKDSNNDSFLTVGADGFKVDGIKDEIDAKIGALDATVGDTTVASGKHVAVQVVEDAGVITAVTVTEDNIADADDLAELSAKTVTALTSTNGSITASIDDAVGCKTYDIETDASKIKMSAFTSTDVLSGITSSSSVTEAFQEVDRVITSNEQVTASALNDLNTRLSAETEARKAVDGQNGDTYAANTGTPYISGATSLNDADIMLANAINTLGGDYIKGVKVNNVELAETDNKVNVQISSAAATGTTSSPIDVATNNSTGAVTLTIEYLDCGTYDNQN